MALRNAGNGAGDTAIGASALVNSSGKYNTALGYAAGDNITTGLDNTVLGAQPVEGSYSSITTGNQNVVIGYNVAAPAATSNGQLVIQNAIYGRDNVGTLSKVSTGCIMLYSKACPAAKAFFVHGAMDSDTHNVCSPTSGWPCETVVRCSIMAGTTCGNPPAAMVPSDSVCVATANGSDTTKGFEVFKLRVSVNKLAVLVRVSPTQTSIAAANIECT
jgi:hypothetical protein